MYTKLHAVTDANGRIRTTLGAADADDEHALMSAYLS